MKVLRQAVFPLAIASAGVLFMGCSSSQTAPAFSAKEQKKLEKEQLSQEMQPLIELEKQYGMGHSQVKQMKMEMGLDPERPAAEQIQQ